MGLRKFLFGSILVIALIFGVWGVITKFNCPDTLLRVHFIVWFAYGFILAFLLVAIALACMLLLIAVKRGLEYASIAICAAISIPILISMLITKVNWILHNHEAGPKKGLIEMLSFYEHALTLPLAGLFIFVTLSFFASEFANKNKKEVIDNENT